MSNGGYKGNTPARETSPEQYPGVWELTEQFQAQADGNWPFQETDCAPKSLRFNQPDSSSLSKTPIAAGNRKTFTLALWIKRNKPVSGFNPTTESIFGAAGGSSWFDIGFYTVDQLQVITNAGVGETGCRTTAQYRDFSAWQQFVIAFDTTNPTANDRIKIFHNGVRQEITVPAGMPAQNSDTFVNSTVAHYFGRDARNSSIRYASHYLSDVHFIDGQALSCEEFGFFDGTGIWQPKRFTGDYASGPVYSNLVQGTLDTQYGNSSAAVPFNGSTGSSYSDGIRPAGGQYLSIDFGTRFTSASTVKIYGHASLDGVSYSGANENLKINGTALTAAEWANNGGGTGSGQQNATFTLSNGLTSLEWGYSSGSQSTGYLYLQGIEVDGVLLQDATVGRNSFHLDFSGGVKDQSGLSNDWTPNNIGGPALGYIAGIAIGAPSNVTLQSAEHHKMFNGDKSDYCYAHTNDATNFIQWTPSGGYPTDGHIWIQGGDGNGGGTNGMTVQINGSTVSRSAVVDNEVYSSGSYGWGDWHKYPVAGNTLTSLKLIGAYALIRQLSTVADPTHSVLGISDDNDVPAIEDTLSSATDYFVDSPVNGNQTDPSGLGGIVQGNYATWNPLTNSSVACSDGNLVANTTSNDNGCFATQSIPDNGKVYFEFTCIRRGGGGSQSPLIGVGDPAGVTVNINAQNSSNNPFTWLYGGNGYKTGGDSSTTSYGDAFIAGDVIGVCIDRSSSRIWFSKNNVWQNSGDPTDPTDSNAAFTNVPSSGTLIPFYGNNNSTSGYGSINFGAHPFNFSAPTGFKALCTTNSPEPSIPVPSQYFDAKVYSGSGSARTFDDLSLSPDFVWIKCTSDSAGHGLYDRVRGENKVLRTDSNAVENDSPVYGYLNQFGSNGFSLTPGTHSSHSLGDVNMTGRDYVAFSWDAGEATTTIAAGGLNSSAYDQSQTWSGMFSPAPSGSGQETRTFDGTVGIQPGYMNGGGSWVPTNGLTYYDKVEVYDGVDQKYAINGGTQTAIALSQWVTIASTTNASGATLNSIDFTRISDASTTHGPAAIKIDGKLLVDSGVSVPNVPSIASTVRSSPESGFSIIKASVDSTNTLRTVGHNLGKEPEFIISKNLEWEDLWFTYHKDIQTDNKQYMNLNGYTGRTSSGSTIWGHTPHVMGFNGALWVPGGATDEIIFYCFTSVEGYSKISSYFGSGNQQFIHCGFTPAWIMIKRYTDNTVGQWSIYNTTSSPNNEVRKKIWADDTASEENHPNNSIDIVSNGFVIDPGGDAPNVQYTNNGSVGYLYIAIAESPFKTARAR